MADIRGCVLNEMVKKRGGFANKPPLNNDFRMQG